MGVLIAIASVFLGCGSNILFLEMLVKEDPGAGNLVTFLQFVFISLIGFIFVSRCGTKKPHIKIKDYLLLVIMFFSANLLNNYAFDFNIPMPLHMIFRSGSLITNMIMGIIILKKKYTLDKYVSVGMITLGIIICTVVSGQKVEKIVGNSTVSKETTKLEDFMWWSVGIACLTMALLISARMGIVQEVLYKKGGKHPYEALYYTHLIPLPGFLILTPNLLEHFSIAMSSKIVSVWFLDLPCILIYLIGNIVTQYVCISSVYYLTTECSSLTVTLVVTLRKFVSLIFSIFYFQNPFTFYHWVGTLLVFGGTIIFTEVPQKIYSVRKSSKKLE